MKPRFCPYCAALLKRGFIEEHYSVATVARLLDCSEKAVRNWIGQRQIGFVKVGRMVRIPASELDRIMEKVESVPELAEQTLAKDFTC